jgi:hypothetical protein
MQLKKVNGEEVEEKKLLLPLSVRNRLIQYLSGKTYNEVFQIIPVLNNLEFYSKPKENEDGRNEEV